MHTWFTVKIRYESTCADGKNRKVSELYMVDALSFTEAEARVIESTKSFAGGMMVSAIKRENITEWFPSTDSEDGKWYRIKAAFITITNKGKEKRSNYYSLVAGSDTTTAERRFRDKMKDSLADYEILEVKETGIEGVYPYVPAGVTDETR